MTDPDDAERLRALKSRIDAARQKQEGPEGPARPGHHEQAHVAWRMVIELTAGIAIGVAIGLGLDELFGTRPILLVLFTLLGFAAGVRTMLGTAADMAKGPPGATPQGQRRKPEPGEERDRRRG